MISYCLLNNQLMPSAEATIAAQDRGWTLADGCFETMRVVAGKVCWLDDHLARLRTGLALLGIAPPSIVASLPSAITRLLAAHGWSEAIARLTISRGVVATRGLLPAESAGATSVLTLAPLPALPDQPETRRVMIARSTRRNEWSPLIRCKALASYPDHVLALREAHDQGADDALLRNTAGYLACATTANLLIRQGHVLHAPDERAGALPGVLRRHLLTAARAWGLTIHEEPIRPAILATADEVLLTNVGRGVQAVIAVDGQPIGTGQRGPCAAQVLAWCRSALTHQADNP